MDRREFVGGLSAAMVAGSVRRSVSHPARRPAGDQTPTLGPEIFARRLDRLRTELGKRKLDLFFATPSTNFRYFTGYNPGRSERLIALLVPVSGQPVVICPSFEVERITRNGFITDVRGWEEQQDPWKLVRTALEPFKPKLHPGDCAVEATLDYASYLRLVDTGGPNWRFQTAAPVTERLRVVKFPEEIDQIRRAIDITEASIAATFAALAPGLTERDVAGKLSDEMRSRGAGGGGLVQFGPSSALPHGGPGGTAPAKETVVLIDAGCEVNGYNSDITRTIWYGDAPSAEFKKVFNLVHDAQTAAMQLGKPFTVHCQEMDRAGRKVIADGGYGQYFTHRLGHGLGMDGHEVPYLVEGNEVVLEPGFVVTIEPGVYQVGKFGVRIEDDVRITDDGLEVLSHRPAKF